MTKHLYTLSLVALGASFACGGIDPGLPFGDTAIAIVVNPVENEGNTEPPPFVSDLVASVDISADPGGAATTDSTGLALLQDLEEGPIDLIFEGDALLPFDIISEGDVYDLAVAFDGQQAVPYPGFPIRYGSLWGRRRDRGHRGRRRHPRPLLR